MSGIMQNLTGETIISADGKKYKLGEMAGYGSQGVVYEDSSGKKMIKLYYPSGSEIVDEDIIERLRFIRDVKMPKNFVTILDIIDRPYIGYVMNKVEGHKPLNAYLIQDKNLSFSEWYNQGLGLRERLFIGYIIAKAFGELEKSNLSYCDISGNNILVQTGDAASIKMIDVDNIYVAGKGKATVLGTPRYIAPEVISRQKNPDVLSDNYSLAVILFELLRVGHPYISDEIMDGTPEDEELALAGGCEYVNDENSTNMLPEDIVFTEKLKVLFEKCFVNGKNNRLERPSAKEFEYALLEASNKVIRCPSCGKWHYPRKTGKSFDGCPWCDAPSKPIARMNFYDVLSEGTDFRLYSIDNCIKQNKLVNTFILREGINRITSLYVLRADDPSKEKRSSDNYITIAKDKKGFWAYNEFENEGITIRRDKKNNKFVEMKYDQNKKVVYSSSIGSIVDPYCYYEAKKNKPVLLNNGDCIFFGVNNGNAVTVDVAGKDYSFIRMARFMEETTKDENI